MQVIWAHGQEEEGYTASPRYSPAVPGFFKDDVLKYHGRTNRGQTTINFHDEIRRSVNDQSALDFCGGEWKYPRSCRSAAEDCQYHARWEFNENTDLVNFTVSSRNPDKKNKWTGIGFSDNAQMQQVVTTQSWPRIDKTNCYRRTRSSAGWNRTGGTSSWTCGPPTTCSHCWRSPRTFLTCLGTWWTE